MARLETARMESNRYHRFTKRLQEQQHRVSHGVIASGNAAVMIVVIESVQMCAYVYEFVVCPVLKEYVFFEKGVFVQVVD